MINKTILIAFLTLFTVASNAAEGALTVSKQATLDVQPATAWALLGDFNGLNNWHPAVTGSELNSNGQKRVLTLGDGAKIHETQLSHSDADMSYTYKITESPLPVSDYVSTIKVERNALGTSTVTWSSSYNAAGVPDEKAIEIISGVYGGGLQSLETLY
ncbi:MAG: SRPBCC family protein [Gammaproteobacteria bacterium]